MRVIVDIHEPQIIIKLLEKLLVPTMVMKITPGDYIIGNIGIERKSIYDFHQSIIKRRLFDQISRLKDVYDKSILIVEGPVDQLFRDKDYKPYIGALVTVIIDFETPIIFTRNIEETAYTIRSIWNRLIKEKKITKVRYKPRLMDEEERKLFVLQGLPDIGPKLADKLLQRFGTLRKVFNASIDQLMGIEGIGDKKAEEIYRIINSPYKPKNKEVKLL